MLIRVVLKKQEKEVVTCVWLEGQLLLQGSSETLRGSLHVVALKIVSKIPQPGGSLLVAQLPKVYMSGA